MVRERCGVRLTGEQRDHLEHLVRAGKGTARVAARARILLKTDAGWPAPRVAQALDVSEGTVYRIKRRFAEDGLEGVLRDRPLWPTREGSNLSFGPSQASKPHLEDGSVYRPLWPMFFPTRFVSTKCAMLCGIVPTPGLAPHEPGERPKDAWVAWAGHVHPCSAASQPAYAGVGILWATARRKKERKFAFSKRSTNANSGIEGQLHSLPIPDSNVRPTGRHQPRNRVLLRM